VAIEIRVHKKFSSQVNRARLKRVAQRALNAERKLWDSGGGSHAARMLGRGSPSRLSLTIYVATDAEIRLLNRKFHATNAVTDVLSFPSRRGESQTRPYLGDIAISYDRARVQARQAKWRIADELDLLVVHGALHLLGYDDVTPRKRAKMWAKQEEILGKVNK